MLILSVEDETPYEFPPELDKVARFLADESVHFEEIDEPEKYPNPLKVDDVREFLEYYTFKPRPRGVLYYDYSICIFDDLTCRTLFDIASSGDLVHFFDDPVEERPTGRPDMDGRLYLRVSEHAIEIADVKGPTEVLEVKIHRDLTLECLYRDGRRLFIPFATSDS